MIKGTENIYISNQEQQEKTKRLSIYTRAENAPSMRLTGRDKAILEAIQSFDGMLADYQIQRLFFQGKRQMQYRMSLLFHHGYVSRPDRRRRVAIPNMVYWLSKNGARYVAGLSGMTLQNFKYREEPKWFTLEHDIAINNFRLNIAEACHLYPEFGLEQWVPDGEFWAHPDRVEFKLPNGRKRSSLIRPDGYFSILHKGYRYKFLLEIDRATEDNPRFVRQKVLPGVAYLGSKAYKQRFGGENSGRWLIVTTGERRQENLIAQTRSAVKETASLFYFITFDQIRADIVLNKPIWKRADTGSLEPLVDSRL